MSPDIITKRNGYVVITKINGLRINFISITETSTKTLALNVKTKADAHKRREKFDMDHKGEEHPPILSDQIAFFLESQETNFL